MAHATTLADGSIVMVGLQATRRDHKDPFSPSTIAPLIARVRGGKLLWSKVGNAEGSFSYVLARGDELVTVGQMKRDDGDSVSVITAFTPTGVVRWQKQLDLENNFAQPASVRLVTSSLAEDGVLLVGTRSQPSSCPGLFLVDLARDGTVRWQQWYEGIDVRPEEVLTVADGYVIVGHGIFDDPEHSRCDLGSLPQFPPPPYSKAAADAVMKKRQQIMLSRKYNASGVILKFGKDGRVLWQKSYSPNSSGFVNGITVAHDGGVLIGGFTNAGKKKNSGYVIKVDPTGKMGWQKTYSVATGYTVASLARTTNGYIGLAQGSPSLATTLFFIDKKGALQSARAFRTQLDFSMQEVIRLPQGFALVGASGIFDSLNEYHPVVIQTNGKGNVPNLKPGPLRMTNGSVAVAPINEKILDGDYLEAEDTDYTFVDASIAFTDAQFRVQKITK
ncbi:hypothetical protein HY629_02420 [Candidatus Uhrbacteria bacterium]|nr:hypothetical protein [Candidatus Uhrbacteria bacterium]